MELPPEAVTALAAFAAVVAAQLLKGAVRMISSWVKRTPTNIDDKIWAAVMEGFGDVLNDRDLRREAEEENGDDDPDEPDKAPIPLRRVSSSIGGTP